MRIRTAVLSSLAIVATWFCAGAAPALEIGPVSVPVQPPPPVTVTVPPTVTVGPVDIPVSQLAPGTSASVTISPSTGVGVSASLPSSVGPIPLAPGAPHDVQVGLGPSNEGVPPSSLSPPAAPGAVDVAASGELKSPTSRGTAPGSRAGTQAASAPSAAALRSGNHGHVSSPISGPLSTSIQSQPAVSASLQHEGSDGPWSLFHDLTSGHGLWIALLLIVAVARFASGGLLRDALRRRARLSST